MRNHVAGIVTRATRLSPSDIGVNPLATPRRALLRRSIQIQATPSSLQPSTNGFDSSDPAVSSLNPPLRTSVSEPSDAPDARFEIIGHNLSSLLSISLSPSQNLYTRRGTLAGVSSSNPEQIISTLSVLPPVSRAILGIPFLYQRIQSSAPTNLLVSTKKPHTSFSILHLDGSTDWVVAQRNGLAAYTGQRLAVKPRAQYRMAVAHWGNTLLTGRGLVALIATGQTFQISLKAGEKYIAHPSNVLAYSLNPTPPLPYRFKSRSLRFQIPSLPSNWYPKRYRDFKDNMRQTAFYKFVASSLWTLRLWARRTVFGDRLFLHFQGPGTILLQSRGGRIVDALSKADVEEIASTPTGTVQEAVRTSWNTGTALTEVQNERVRANDHAGMHVNEHKLAQARKPGITYANVGPGGKVSFEKQSS